MVWFLWWFILVSEPVIYGEKRDNKEWDLNWEHPRVSRDIREGVALRRLILWRLEGISECRIQHQSQFYKTIMWFMLWTSARELSFWAYRVGQDPSDSKSNRLHVDIFRFWCFHSFEVCSIDSSKMIGKFPTVLNLNQLFLSNSTGSSATNCWFFSDTVMDAYEAHVI